jgi:A/G-specific adenine glycosylase
MDNFTRSSYEKEINYFRDKLLLWLQSNSRNFPWRNTSDPYNICIAEILLHQTFARKVVPVYKIFVKRYPDINKLSRSRVPSLEKLIYPLGFLYRAKRLKEMAKVVVKEFNGEMPINKTGLLSLPGVGEYTASAIMCFAYGDNVPIIDTNAVRVYSRFFEIAIKLPNSSPNKEIRKIAERVLAKDKAREFNYGILDFAAVVCSHYNPKCDECPANNNCKYWENHIL